VCVGVCVCVLARGCMQASLSLCVCVRGDKTGKEEEDSCMPCVI